MMGAYSEEDGAIDSESISVFFTVALPRREIPVEFMSKSMTSHTLLDMIHLKITKAHPVELVEISLTVCTNGEFHIFLQICNTIDVSLSRSEVRYSFCFVTWRTRAKGLTLPSNLISDDRLAQSSRQ